MTSEEGSKVTHSRSQESGGRISYCSPPTFSLFPSSPLSLTLPPPSSCHPLANFVILASLFVSFISMKSNVAKIGSLAKLVLNSILFLGFGPFAWECTNWLFLWLLSLYYSQGSLESPLLLSSLSCLIIDGPIFCSFQSFLSSSWGGELSFGMGEERRGLGYHGVGDIAVLLKDLWTFVILIPLSHLY